MAKPMVAYMKWRKSKGQFSLRLMGGNHECVVPSERFTRKSTMLKSIQRWNEDTLKVPVPVIECNTRWKPIKK